MAAADLLERNPNPTEDEVRDGLEGNLCRCTGYHNIVKAVLAAGEKMSGRGGGRVSTVEEPTLASAPLGGRMRRKEDPRLITGRGHYVDDIVLPGMLYMAIVRSPEAHARIVSIDTSAALARPGVQAVFTGEDLDLGAPLPMVWVPPGVEIKTPEHWPLARGAVKHVGEPVAVVVGDDKYAVVDAAEDVIVEYDPLPVVVDPGGALEDGSPLVCRRVRHQPDARVVAGRRRHGGRLRRGRRHRRAAHRQPPHRRRCDRAARRARRLPRRLAHALDLHADPAPRSALFLAGELGLGEDRIRVIAPDVGGGFGMQDQPLRRGDAAPAGRSRSSAAR